jgi:peptide/nickel transport system substrate-binding protein
MFSWGWIPDPDPDSMLNNMTCDERPPDGKTYGTNDAYYCNPEYDQLFAGRSCRRCSGSSTRTPPTR